MIEIESKLLRDAVRNREKPRKFFLMGLMIGFLGLNIADHLSAACQMASIIMPVKSLKYSPGEKISYIGAGNQGTCVLADYEWQVDYFNDAVDAKKPLVTALLPNEQSGSFVVPSADGVNNFNRIKISLRSAGVEHGSHVIVEAGTRSDGAALVYSQDITPE